MKIRMATVLTMLCVAGSAQASGLYVLGEVSHSKTSLDTPTLDDLLTGAGATGVASSDSNTGNNKWRLQLGYAMNNYLALEAGYIDLGKADYSATYAGGTASGRWKAAGPDIAALGILPVNNALSVFGKLGVIDAKVKTNLTATGSGAAATASVDDTSAKVFYGGGAMLNLTENTGMRLEYERFNNLGAAATTGKGDVNVVSLGISYNF